MGGSLGVTRNTPACRIGVKAFSEARLSLPLTHYRFCKLQRLLACLLGVFLEKSYVFSWNQKSI